MGAAEPVSAQYYQIEMHVFAAFWNPGDTMFLSRKIYWVYRSLFTLTHARLICQPHIILEQMRSTT